MELRRVLFYIGIVVTLLAWVKYLQNPTTRNLRIAVQDTIGYM